ITSSSTSITNTESIQRPTKSPLSQKSNNSSFIISDNKNNTIGVNSINYNNIKEPVIPSIKQTLTLNLNNTINDDNLNMLMINNPIIDNLLKQTQQLQINANQSLNQLRQ